MLNIEIVSPILTLTFVSGVTISLTVSGEGGDEASTRPGIFFHTPSNKFIFLGVLMITLPSTMVSTFHMIGE